MATFITVCTAAGCRVRANWTALSRQSCTGTKPGQPGTEGFINTGIDKTRAAVTSGVTGDSGHQGDLHTVCPVGCCNLHISTEMNTQYSEVPSTTSSACKGLQISLLIAKWIYLLFF